MKIAAVVVSLDLAASQFAEPLDNEEYRVLSMAVDCRNSAAYAAP